MKQLPRDLESEDRRSSPPPGMKSCCICFTPKQGTVLLGILHLLKHTAGLVFCCIYLLNQSLHDKLTMMFYRAEQEALLEDGGSTDYGYFWNGGYSGSMTYDEFEDSLTFMAKVGAGLATLLFIIAMFLLHGVANRKPGFVLPFYIYGIFDIGFTIFWIFQYCTDALTKYEFAGLCAFLVILFFKIYFMGCVWSTYRQIQWEKSIKPLTNTLGMNLPPKYEEAMRNGDLPPAYVP